MSSQKNKDVQKLQELATARAILESKQAKEAAVQLAKELAWRKQKNRRKGEIMPDFSDKRSRMQKHSQNRAQQIKNRLRRMIKSEAREVIEEKIAHFQKTGNARKLAIYQAKLQDHKNALEKVKDRLTQ